MTPRKRVVSKVCYPTTDIVYAAEALIAASSMITAIHADYVNNGSFSVGALMHVEAVVDGVIDKLGLAELEIDQQKLPF